MGEVSAWIVIGPVIAMGMMTFSGFRLLEKYRDLVFRHGSLEVEVKELRRRNMAGDNWQEMLPFPFDDASQVIVINNRVPTDQDKIDAEVPVIWLSMDHQRSWTAVPATPGQWHENTHCDDQGYNHFYAITAGDQFIYIHTSEHPGLRRLTDTIVNSDGHRIEERTIVQTARDLPNVVSRLLDSAGGDNCTSWQDMVAGSKQGRLPGRRTPDGDRPRPINLGD